MIQDLFEIPGTVIVHSVLPADLLKMLPHSVMHHIQQLLQCFRLRPVQEFAVFVGKRAFLLKQLQFFLRFCFALME